MAAAETNAQPAPFSALRVALIVIAAIATLGAIAELPLAFHDFGFTDPWLVDAQRVTSAKLIIAPLIAAVAVAFAAVGRVRITIATLAALMLVHWASDLPTFPIHGIEPSFSTLVVMTAVERVVFPLLAVAALLFAARDRHLAAAAAIVTLPMILTVTGAILFSFGIMMHGL